MNEPNVIHCKICGATKLNPLHILCDKCRIECGGYPLIKL